MGYFQARGYDCHAIDLSGHGASEGSERLDQFGLDDYAQDVATARAEIDGVPVLIGHSMGTIVVQHYLQHGDASGVALLSPVPPTGMSTASVQLNTRQPTFVKEAARTLHRKYREDTLRVIREVYFSPDADEAHMQPFLDTVQAESTLVLTELMALAMHLPRRRRRLPALVMGGEFDAVFPANMLHFTATGWNGRTHVVPRAGHMLMLDPQWTDAAAALERWLEGIAAG